MKICSKCKIEKEDGEFHRSLSSSTGLQSQSLWAIDNVKKGAKILIEEEIKGEE